MVADYVAAGFAKIHLDCSMSCADDPVPLAERTIAERAAKLCQAAEASFAGDAVDAPSYVIGTEVPVPGGATEISMSSCVTSPDAALATIAMHRDLFADSVSRTYGTGSSGRSFSRASNSAITRSSITSLRKPWLSVGRRNRGSDRFRGALDGLPDASGAGRVGPRPFRDPESWPRAYVRFEGALWALDAIERETISADRRANLRDVTLARMHAEPAHWSKYYHGSGAALDLQLQYSFSDRIRYYWPDKIIADAHERLFANLREVPPPLALVSQYLPIAFDALRGGRITSDPVDLVIAHVCATLDAYHGACNFNG